MPIPKTDEDFTEWAGILADIGTSQNIIAGLRKCISKKEIKFGLKTHDYKSVWKVHVAVKGHENAFEALAWWLAQGHKLIIVKGNHDLELYWLAVRNYLRLVFAERVAKMRSQTVTHSLLQSVLPNVTFIDDSVVIDKQIYIEHGHRYDKFTTVLGKPTIGKHNEEINIPFGSFFNRYLVNKLELKYPFYDNVRPQDNIIHMLMRDDFFMGLKVLFYYLPFAIRMVRKRYLKYMLKPLSGYLFALGIPLLIALFLWGNRLLAMYNSLSSNAPQTTTMLGIAENYGVGLLKDTAVLFLGYLLSRFIAHVQLDEPGSLLDPGKAKLRENKQYRCVTMGHTHNPEQYEEDGRWYINTSTWIPVIESDSAALREDKTYAVLSLQRDANGLFNVLPLQRWNDAAGRIEQLTIVEGKDELD